MENIRISAFADEACQFMDGQIEALKRNSLYGLEIRMVDGKNVSGITRAKAKEVLKKLENAGLEVWSIGSPIGKIDIEAENFSKHADKFRHTLEIAEILGAKNIRVFSFYMPDGANPALFKNEVVDKLGRLCDIAEDYDVVLCHENEKGIYGDNAQRCLEIHKALPKFRAVFDPANFVQCGQDTICAWELLKDYVHYMHIKDSLSDGSIVPAGYGDGNIPHIVNEYIKRGGRHFTMEPHLTVFQGLSDLEKEGNTSEVGKKYTYPNENEAFDAACRAFKDILALTK